MNNCHFVFISYGYRFSLDNGKSYSRTIDLALKPKI